jgi:hypothetical protein
MQLEKAPLFLENIQAKITPGPPTNSTQLHGYGLEICERCRLRQQNSPAAPENSAALGEKSLKTVCFDLFILKQALKQTHSVSLRVF